MKNLFNVFLFLSVGLFISSCGEDTCDVLADNVVGTWSIEALGSGSVTIDADGSFTETENLVFDNTHDSNTKTWTVSGNTFTLLSMDDNNGTTEVILVATSFDCDIITANNGGNEFILRRI